MSDPTRPRSPDETDAEEPTEHDPDMGSTWNTIPGTVDVEDLMAEEEIEDFMAEPTEGELGILSDTDVPGRPG